VDTSERAVAHREPTRRRWAVEEKRRIVEQTLAAGGRWRMWRGRMG
jgi:hypothetical protein